MRKRTSFTQIFLGEGSQTPFLNIFHGVLKLPSPFASLLFCLLKFKVGSSDPPGKIFRIRAWPAEKQYSLEKICPPYGHLQGVCTVCFFIKLSFDEFYFCFERVSISPHFLCSFKIHGRYLRHYAGNYVAKLVVEAYIKYYYYQSSVYYIIVYF